MESLVGISKKERQRQAGILKQIAALKAQLPDEITDLDTPILTSPRRKQEASVLVPATPSPRKKRKIGPTAGSSQSSSTSHSTSHKVLKTSSAINGTQLFQTSSTSSDHIAAKPAPSNVLNKLASLSSMPAEEDQSALYTRTTAFADKPHLPNYAHSAAGGPIRDERLAIIEDLEPGPVDHQPPFDDPHFEQLEPNSGIRLSSRILPHEDLQDHLRGRYYLSPSRLYSCIRLLPNKQGYDVPVAGDWITIAVVAERGPIKYTNPPVGIGKDDDDNEPKGKGKDKGKDKSKGDGESSRRRRYINIKLIDFGSRSSSSSTSGKAVIRGDAFLSLLLFEAEGFDTVTEGEGKKPKKVYRGGSKGAFEAMSKLKEGDVIALLNPRIMKPFTGSSNTPHPISNILGVTPESASSITHIGRAKDLGMCTVLKRDGKPCGSWCDKRVATVCDYHLQNAVQRSRAARAEFSAGTSGMTNSATSKRKFGASSTYDPLRKTGLQPAQGHTYDADVGTTYFVSGHAVKGDGVDSMHVAENMGREAQAKAQRLQIRKETDKVLEKMLSRDKEGMQVVMKAREAMEKVKKEKKSTKRKREDAGNDGEAKRSHNEDDADADADVTLDKGNNSRQKQAYSATMIKCLGFDPSGKTGQSQSNTATRKKLDDLALLQKSRKGFQLGPRPGPKIRSGIVVPASAASTEGERMINLDSDD